MIEKFEDLEIGEEDEEDAVAIKVKDKLGLSLEEMKNALKVFLLSNADRMAEDMMNIAPYGDYGELIEDKAPMSKFLQEDVSKIENWKLNYIKSGKDSNISFIFLSSAVDDGDVFRGFVVVSFSGKILHAFCQGDN
jgi:hypothetical protein